MIIAGMQMPSNMGPQFTEEFRAVFPRVAAEKDAALVPFLIESVGGIAAMNQDDLIHPNAEGQKRVARNVWAGRRGSCKHAERDGSSVRLAMSIRGQSDPRCSGLSRSFSCSRRCWLHASSTRGAMRRMNCENW